MLETIQTLDWSLLHGIQGLRCGALDALMPVVTHLGDVGAVWLLAGSCSRLHCASGAGACRRRPRSRGARKRGRRA